jgi:hypothetical protein
VFFWPTHRINSIDILKNTHDIPWHLYIICSKEFVNDIEIIKTKYKMRLNIIKYRFKNRNCEYSREILNMKK